MSKTSKPWLVGDYFISKSGMKEAVSSPVSPDGVWGIRKDGGGFTVTHIPTGLKLSIQGEPWPTMRLARKFVSKLQPMTNWRRSDPKAYPKNLRAKVDAVTARLVKPKSTP